MRLDILDHGYIELVTTWGSDEDIIRAARMSTNKGFQGWGTPEAPGDEKLLKYLYTNKHFTPFEMAGLIVEVQAPIFVFREWHRHRTQSYNEMSGRYTELPDLYYIPSIERIQAQGKTNKQSSGEGLDPKVQQDAWNAIKSNTEGSRKIYEYLLKWGVAREVARLVLPVNQYSRMRASANLRNWLGFCTLRSAEGAQWEIRQYSQAMEQIIAENFPRTYELYKL